MSKKLVEELLAKAEQTDRQEEASYGVRRRGDELPEDLRRAKSRLARIRKAKDELEAEAKQARSDDDEDDDSSGSAGGDGSDLPAHRIPTLADGTPTSKAQRNFTDAQSRIMKTGDGFVQGYNAQVVVDDAAQVIVAQAVTNQPPDAEHFVPMLERTIANCGAAPRRTSADNGYFSERNVAAALDRGVEPYIAAGRSKHGEPRPTVRGRPRADLTPKERMARKLATRSGAAIYARRKAIVEPVFGQIKQGRGLRSFLMRGVTKVRGEWALICVGHNLRKLHTARAGL